MSPLRSCFPGLPDLRDETGDVMSESEPRDSLHFVGEIIRPAANADALTAAGPGGPLLPQRFSWRDRELRVGTVLRAWSETGPCRHGSGERYVRRHWFRVRTQAGSVLEIYFDRQPRRGRPATERWCLYAVSE